MNQTVKCQIHIPEKEETLQDKKNICNYELFNGVLILCRKDEFFLMQIGGFRSILEAKKYAKTVKSYAGEKNVFILHQDFLYKVMIGHFPDIEEAHSAVNKIKPLLEAENEKGEG